MQELFVAYYILQVYIVLLNGQVKMNLNYSWKKNLWMDILTAGGKTIQKYKIMKKGS